MTRTPNRRGNARRAALRIEMLARAQPSRSPRGQFILFASPSSSKRLQCSYIGSASVGEIKPLVAHLHDRGGELMRPNAAAVMTAVVTAVKDGDMSAAEILLRRLGPEWKGRPIMLELPNLDNASNIVPAIGAVASAVASGEMSPDEGQTVAAISRGIRHTGGVDPAGILRVERYQRIRRLTTAANWLASNDFRQCFRTGSTRFCTRIGLVRRGGV